MRAVANFNVPWRNMYDFNRIALLRKEAVFSPCVVTHKDTYGNELIKGLYVRIHKKRLLQFIISNKLYGKPTTDEQWGIQRDVKVSLVNAASNCYKNPAVQADMKNILTAITLTPNDPIHDIVIPDVIQNVNLKFYQAANVRWMYKMERSLDDYAVNVDVAKEVMPRVFFDHSEGIIYDSYQPTKRLIPKGGGIFDEVGLGKTLTAITLIAMNPAPDNIGCAKGTAKPKTEAEKPKAKPKSKYGTCKFVLKTGTRKGEECGKNINVLKPAKANLDLIAQSVGGIAVVPNAVAADKADTDKKAKSFSLDFLILHEVCNTHAKNVDPTKTKTKAKVEAPKALPVTDVEEQNQPQCPSDCQVSNDTPVATVTITPSVPVPTEPEEHVEMFSDRWISRATLVVCPNQIPYQWVSQIEKYTSPKLNTVTITCLNEAKTVTYRDIINADIVITTIDCIERGTVTSCCDEEAKKTDVELKKARLDMTNPMFDFVMWHRVMVDEMHVITNKKYSIAPFELFKIQSIYRWAITGTPFDKDQLNYEVIVSWLFGDSKYHKEPIRRVFNKLQQNSRQLTALFRRNTKKSTELVQHEVMRSAIAGTANSDDKPSDNAMQLVTIGNGPGSGGNSLWQKVTQHELWLELSKIERSMYKARQASKPYWMKDQDDEYLRQICCHPNLNAENSTIVKNVHQAGVRGGGTRYATNASDVKDALLKNTKDLIANMITNDIPMRIQNSWAAYDLYHQDTENKRNRMAYYGSLLQIKRAFFRLYQLKKSYRAYNDINNSEKTPIIITSCDSCNQHISVTSDTLTIHVGQCGHIFCEPCARRQVPIMNFAPKVVTIADADDPTVTKKPKTAQVKQPKLIAEKKTTEGRAKCATCYRKVVGNVSTVTSTGGIDEVKPEDFMVKTTGLVDAIKIDIAELIDTVDDSNDGPCASVSEQNSADYIPNQFKQEMECAIGLYGTKITHLVAYLKTYTAHPHNQRIIIFSQWDNLLQGIKETLENFDLPVMTCKGNVFQKKKANLNFKSNNYYKIILLSSKYAASGLDLIEASKIIFIDPIYGDFDTTKQIEDQAIGRAHRLGQQKPVEVVRFLIKDTIEEECYTKWKQQRFKYEA